MGLGHEMGACRKGSRQGAVMAKLVASGVALALLLGTLGIVVPTTAIGMTEWQRYEEHGSSIEWRIDEEGTLTLRPASGDVGVLRYNEHELGTEMPPWSRVRGTITGLAVPEGCTIALEGSMYRLFAGCTGMREIEMTGLDTSGVTSLQSAFRDCTGLTTLDLSDVDTSSVRSMDCTLDGCDGLTAVRLGSRNALQGASPSDVARLPGTFGAWVSEDGKRLSGRQLAALGPEMDETQQGTWKWSPYLRMLQNV